jgi:hypothetical protein
LILPTVAFQRKVDGDQEKPMVDQEESTSDEERREKGEEEDETDWPINGRKS